MQNTNKIEWIFEEEDDIKVGAESADGRFSIDGRYIEGDKPSYFQLCDNARKVEKQVDTIKEGRELAEQWLVNPPQTREELKTYDMSHSFKYRAMAQFRATTYGMKVVENSDGTFKLENK